MNAEETDTKSSLIEGWGSPSGGEGYDSEGAILRRQLAKEEAQLQTRANILAFEEYLKGLPGSWEGDSENCPLTHQFPPGLYVRTIFIPAATVIVGKLHRHQHPNILHCGIVEVATEFDGVQILEGPLFMISKGLTKRALIAHTDVIWTTIHANPKNLTDPAELEKDIIISDLTEYKKGLLLS